ncbi:MAG: FRG domain-containing protein [Terracidiphilus sp.]
MPVPADWSQKQNTALAEYKKSQDSFGIGPWYDELFSKLIWAETATSWRDFLDWVGELQGPWCFRGQRESAWTLRTSLDRAVRVSHENVKVSTPDGRYYLSSGSYHLDRRAVENESLFRFQQQAHQFIPHTPPVDDKASWLALMQHHGVPTRLLDWTSSPYVALYFAIEKAPREKNDEKKKAKEGKANEEKDDGCSAVWAMDLHWLETKKQKFLESKDPKGRTAHLNDLLDQCDRPLIVKIDPPQGNERMSAQQGFFLWKLYEETPFFDQILISMMIDPIQERPVIRKLKIGMDLRIGFLESLRSMNIHSGSLFPGLDGFCQSLKTELEIRVANEARLSREFEEREAKKLGLII